MSDSTKENYLKLKERVKPSIKKTTRNRRSPELPEDLLRFARMITVEQESLHLKTRVNSFRKRLMDFCDSIEQDAKLEYTGWYVLLKKKEDGWECLGTFNSNTASDLEESEPEWDICIPIPKPEFLGEFEGW